MGRPLRSLAFTKAIFAVHEARSENAETCNTHN
jgi:hypothetical protein